jgi:predicted GNAT family acetyltransferase
MSRLQLSHPFHRIDFDNRLTFTPAGPMTLVIEHLADQRRFQARVEGQACVIDYELADGVMTITHTGVPQALEGRGIAAELTRAALAHARQAHLKVRPL